MHFALANRGHRNHYATMPVKHLTRGKSGHCRALAFAFACSLAGMLLPAIARAGGSSPVLSITGADTLATPAGVRSVTITGSFNFDDLLQFSFPAGAIITQGSHFVRYDLSGKIVAGTAAAVTNGIAASEIPALLAVGTAAASPAAVVQLRVDRISVALPSDFAAGAASVILYALLDGDSVVSNPVSVTLP